jgi:hypothetical protein
MCTLLSLSTIASLGVGITNTLEKIIISYCSPKIAFLIFLTKIINCNNSANVIHVYQLHILCIKLRVKKKTCVSSTFNPSTTTKIKVFINLPYIHMITICRVSSSSKFDVYMKVGWNEWQQNAS